MKEISALFRLANNSVGDNDTDNKAPASTTAIGVLGQTTHFTDSEGSDDDDVDSDIENDVTALCDPPMDMDMDMDIDVHGNCADQPLADQDATEERHTSAIDMVHTVSSHDKDKGLPLTMGEAPVRPPALLPTRRGSLVRAVSSPDGGSALCDNDEEGGSATPNPVARSQTPPLGAFGSAGSSSSSSKISNRSSTSIGSIIVKDQDIAPSTAAVPPPALCSYHEYPSAKASPFIMGKSIVLDVHL